MRANVLFTLSAIFIALLIAQQKPSPLVSKPAPNFTLPTIDDKKIRLSDLKGKVVLLNFFSHW